MLLQHNLHKRHRGIFEFAFPKLFFEFMLIKVVHRLENLYAAASRGLRWRSALCFSRDGLKLRVAATVEE